VAEVPDGELTVVAHPVSRQAAAYDDVATPLEAKFSIPYTTAFTLLHGEPGVDAFAAVDDEARELARRVRVRMDPSLAESELALLAGGTELARVHAARGSPERPMSAEQLAAKVGALAGDRLEAAFSGDQRPVEWVLDLIKGTRGS
jgi:2-methylcitrate dehydratase PrpD